MGMGGDIMLGAILMVLFGIGALWLVWWQISCSQADMAILNSRTISITKLTTSSISRRAHRISFKTLHPARMFREVTPKPRTDADLLP